ncbi:MAG: DNA (cytosine-5-)-methyltransferase, partial [Merismopedia sp. SIO2A8]|nr:DNA (cytosine-5-)-methyltransferase [Merismopedia sp. SIO2A8]
MPSKALKAGDHGVPGGENMIRYQDGRIRYYTTFEAKRIQTFPDNYRISGSWTESMRQIGNAVPVELGYQIASSLAQAIYPRSDESLAISSGNTLARGALR